jgi:general nucleoside transport system ATP-binding protein
VLGHVRALTRAGEVTVLMITHKFREVTAFADDLTVLRRGKRVGGGRVADLTPADMAGMMMGEAPKASTRQRAQTDGKVVLHLDGLQAMDRSGLKPIRIDGVTLRAGEILGVAGVSGNGQMELMEILTGQRHLTAGKVMLNGSLIRPPGPRPSGTRSATCPKNPCATPARPG